MAALSVVLFHAQFLFGPNALLDSTYQIKFLSFGHAGVEIFFVLSGYIILRAHWGDPNSWTYFKRYVARRFTRIFPMTIGTVICLLAMTPLLRWLTSDPLLFDISPIKIVTSLSLIPFQCEYLPGTLWSLSNEVLFYLIFAAYFIRPAFFVFGISLLTSLILLNAALPFARPLAACGGSPLNLYNAIFVFGIAAFFVSKLLEKINMPAWMPVAALTTGVAIFAVSAYIDVKYLSDMYFDQAIAPNRAAKMITHFLYAVAGGWIILGASLLSWRPCGAVGRAFTYLGEASFSLYLIHEPALGVTARILHPLTLAGSPRGELALFAIVASSVVLALAVHQFAELRLVDLFRASPKRG